MTAMKKYTYHPPGYNRPKPASNPYDLGALGGMNSPAPTSYAPTGNTAQQPTNPYQFQDSLGLGGPSDGWNFTNTAEWLPYGIQSQLGGLASQGISDLYNSAGPYRDARMQAYTALGPGAAAGQVQNFRQQAMAGAGDQGRQTAAMLRANGVQGADAAAGLDAQNQAANATNQYSQQVNDPTAQAQRFMQQMQLMSPQQAFPMLQYLMALDQSVQSKVGANNQMHAQNAGSGLGGILGNILGMASGGGFGNLGALFGGGGSGGGGNASTNPLDYIW